MALIIVDVESDGPIPSEYSMVCFGAVKLDTALKTTFYGKTKPISEKYNPDALAVSGFNREEHLKFDDPVEIMAKFAEWLKYNSQGKPVLISDNNGYDAAWINYYFHKYYGSNPFGWTSRRIGDLFCGAEHDLHYAWKKHRITPHNHHPISDSLGNAEALLYLFNKYNIKIPN